MAKQKFYALKAPTGGKIVLSWEECEKLTHGVKGMLFKSFATRQEAQNWLDGVSETPKAGLRIYVDGSFLPGYPKAGWGFIVVENDVELARGGGVTSFDAESRNIDGEVMASYQAMKWLAANGKKGIICHDYEGLARWAKGEWKAKSAIAQRYVVAVQPYLNLVKFEKVAAHTGVKWNEAVDQLAKDAIAKAKKGLVGNASQSAQPAQSAVEKPAETAPSAEPVPEPVKDPKTGQMSLPL